MWCYNIKIIVFKRKKINIFYFLFGRIYLKQILLFEKYVSKIIYI